MKKYIYILSIATLGLTSCSSDYLDTVPEVQMGTATILSTTDNAELSLNGICRSMSQKYLETQGMNGEGTILNWYGTFNGNDAQKSNHTAWATVWNNGYHLRSTSPYDYYPWYYYYKLVSNANGIICNIDNAEGTEADKAFLKAQALTFRAYSFFRLAQLYTKRWSDHQGNTEGIVLRLDESTGSLPLATQSETFNQIYKDLDDAIALYKKSGKTRTKFYKPGLDVAYAIYAKAALTREDWQTAADYAALAREGHPLMSNKEYADGFHTPNDEWIWGVFEEENQTLGYYGFYAYIGSNASASNCRSYPVAISKELIDQIPESDVRRELFLVPTDAEYAECAASGRSTKSLYKRAFADYGDRLFETSLIFAYMQFKLMAEFMPGGGSFPVIRAAEMYYTEAEAYCHLNQDAKAQQLLYQVVSPRDAAYVQTTKTGDDLLAEVKLYRRFDLWGEGNDWFDFKRWGDPIVRNTKENGGSFMKNFAVTIKPDEGNAWTWVIPQKETDYNDMLE